MSVDAFVTRFDPPLGPGTGPLAGLRLAVKDNFDLAGHVTGSGCPEWADTHGPADATAPVVQTLMDAGAVVVGKTQMDELAYSLMGANARYGTPPNPAAPDRVPGGSSSGSASAVAADRADIGLGSDTGGSVRIPAAFCGLYGWRPTHGLLPSAGLVPLAASYDVPGVMTRDGALLLQLAALLAPDGPSADGRMLIPGDLWPLADQDTAGALAPHVPPPGAPLFDDSMRADLLPAFRTCQGADVAQALGPWLRSHDPAFGPGVRERFDAALALTESQIAAARATRAGITAHLLTALGEDRVIALPTAPAPAPLLTLTGAGMEDYRNRALTLLCLAGHAGLPQVTVPFRGADGLPIGLSLIGPRGSDRALIARAIALAGA